MESLSDRYVWAVVRRPPHGRRAAVAASLRAELADAIAAESAPGVDSEALLDERLWEFWIPWFIGVAVAELVFAVGAFLIGRWTWIVALVNALLALAFAVPAVVLLWSEDVVSPQFRSTFEGLGPLVDGLLAFAPFIVIAVALLDIIGGVRRVLAARRTA